MQVWLDEICKDIRRNARACLLSQANVAAVNELTSSSSTLVELVAVL